MKTDDRNDHFENWTPLHSDPVARLFSWEDCCFRKMKDGWMFLWQPPGNQYSKGFAGYDQVEAFDKMVDWLEHRRKLAFKELKLGKTLTDITVTIGQPNKKQNKDICSVRI